MGFGSSLHRLRHPEVTCPRGGSLTFLHHGEGQPLNQFCEVIWVGEYVRGYDYQLKMAFSFFFGGKIQWDIIYVPQNSLLRVCFAHFLAHLFGNQPQSNFRKLLLTLKETLFYWWGGREEQYRGGGRGGTNYLMSDGSRMYCTIGGIWSTFCNNCKWKVTFKIVWK